MRLLLLIVFTSTTPVKAECMGQNTENKAQLLAPADALERADDLNVRQNPKWPCGHSKFC